MKNTNRLTTFVNKARRENGKHRLGKGQLEAVLLKWKTGEVEHWGEDSVRELLERTLRDTRPQAEKNEDLAEELLLAVDFDPEFWAEWLGRQKG